MKVRVFTAGTESAAVTRTRNASAALARRATNIHPAVARFIPDVYTPGAPGWSVPYAVLAEPGGTRVALVAEDDFARGRGDFTGATDELPADWKRDGDGADTKPSPDTGGR